MTQIWQPWRRLLLVWLPAVALFLGSGSFYVWQTSDSVGRAAQIRSDIETLEAEIRRLERVRDQADAEREVVATLNGQFEHLYGEVFGDLEDRLTDILRAIGSATRQAGLLPGSFGYTAQPDRKLGYTRFGIQFAVTGEYPQIRTMLAALQASDEFLIVQDIAFSGETDATSRDLRIGVQIATYLAEADSELLDRLTGGLKPDGGESDGQIEG